MEEDTFRFCIGDDEESIGALAALQRGLIVSGYAHVEFVLTDFMVRCSNFVEYESIMPSAFPYALARRLSVLRQVFEAEGPLRKYSIKMNSLIDSLAGYETLRHLAVHGLMTQKYKISDPGQSLVTLKRYDIKEKVLVLYAAEMPLLRLAEKQIEITRYTLEVVKTIHGILQDLQLPPPVGAAS